MFAKNKFLKKKTLFALIFSLILLLLVAAGWIVKNNVALKIKELTVGGGEILRPVEEERVENRLEKRLKELAFKEGLRLIDKPMVENTILIATFSGQLTCLFSLEREIDSQLNSLQFILWRSKIEGRMPKRIDLRFEKPVIKY